MMKSYSNLYDKLCSSENLRAAFRKARKGKSKKWYIREFETDLKNNLLKLRKELVELAYEPRPLKIFVIRDPKTRVISASNFRDRVVHHAVCNIIEPIFDRTFICDSYANRRGKGTHAALRRFDSFKRKVAQNGKLVRSAKDNNMVVGYFLKADIRHYFDSVDHDVLMGIIRNRIYDEKVLTLIRKILNNHTSKIPGKGMPIGNLTSQFFANLYLNELDYFVKHRLKAKYYMRYVDDFVILHRRKEVLAEWKDEINEFLKTIKLELHNDKSKIYTLYSGANLVGFRIFYHYRLPKKSNIQLFTKRTKKFCEMYQNKEMQFEDISKRVDGWLAYVEWSNSYKLCRKIRRKIKKMHIKN